MFVGSWLFQGLNVNKYARDATPIVPPEPIAELQGVNDDTIRRLLNGLRVLISLASIIAWTKKLGLRVFIHGAAIPDPVDDFIRASLAGGADGVIPGDFVKINNDAINVISTSASDSPVGYVMVNTSNINIGNVRSYGVIILDPPADIDWLVRVRDMLRTGAGVKEVFVALGADKLRADFIKSVADMVDGIVIMEIPIIVSLSFDENPALNVFRCPNCYVDYETSNEIRKCPRCGGRVRPVIKPWGKATILKDGVLRLKGLEEIRVMRLEPPKTINL
jgi:hypothetical protein